MRADLHTHSSRSDGTSTPTELVHEALEAGLDVLGLTDHDTAAGWDEAAAAARAGGLTLIRGMELSTTYQGRSVHLLAYLPDPTYPPLAEELAKVNEGRAGRMPEMIERLQQAGYDVSEADVVAAAAPGAVLGRPHVADALVARGVVASRDEAFATLLGKGGVGFVGRYGIDVSRAVSLVRAAGGTSVVAHPWGRNRVLTPAILAALQEAGLAGVEVDHQDHGPADRAELGAIARDLGLVATGSSDYHGTGKVGHDLGVNTTAPDQLEALLGIAASAAAASGRPAPEVIRP